MLSSQKVQSEIPPVGTKAEADRPCSPVTRLLLSKHLCPPSTALCHKHVKAEPSSLTAVPETKTQTAWLIHTKS